MLIKLVIAVVGFILTSVFYKKISEDINRP